MNKYVIGLWVVTMLSNLHIKDNGFEHGKRDYRIKRTGVIDLAESSGVIIDEEQSFWTMGDSGGQPALYAFSFDGQPLDSVFYDITNVDWESLADDDKGNRYIGDFGNNSNQRQDLTIYKVKGDRVDTIQFRWGDQDQFPPEEGKRNFDSEAFFWHKERLYLFSKNRTEDPVRVYTLPDQPGNHVAGVIDQFSLPRQVTGADINPSGTAFALLCYGIIYTFDLKPDSENFFSNPSKAIRLARSGQAEGIAYINDEDLIVTNEAGKVYQLTMRRKRTD